MRVSGDKFCQYLFESVCGWVFLVGWWRRDGGFRGRERGEDVEGYIPV